MPAVHVKDIQPAPEPIRTSWDEEKMRELVNSIHENGLIVPIKVRPVAVDGVNTYYEVVYGHRRLEACKRANIEVIEAVIDGVDDETAMMQALTENLVREDMTHYDVAVALKTIKDQTGKTNQQIAEMFGWEYESTVRQYFDLLRPEVEAVIGTGTDPGFITTGLVHRVLIGAGDDKSIVPQVLKKASEEGLTVRQAHNVAKSIAAAQDPRRKKFLKDVQYSPFLHDPLMNQERADKYGSRDPAMNWADPPAADESWKALPEAKVALDMPLTALGWLDQTQKLIDAGKLPPEGIPFLMARWSKVCARIEKMYEDNGERHEE
jgi:ParB family chromosome partitioning protein